MARRTRNGNYPRPRQPFFVTPLVRAYRSFTAAKHALWSLRFTFRAINTADSIIDFGLLTHPYRPPLAVPPPMVAFPTNSRTVPIGFLACHNHSVLTTSMSGSTRALMNSVSCSHFLAGFGHLAIDTRVVIPVAGLSDRTHGSSMFTLAHGLACHLPLYCMHACIYMRSQRGCNSR